MLAQQAIVLAGRKGTLMDRDLLWVLGLVQRKTLVEQLLGAGLTVIPVIRHFFDHQRHSDGLVKGHGFY